MSNLLTAICTALAVWVIASLGTMESIANDCETMGKFRYVQTVYECTVNDES